MLEPLTGAPREHKFTTYDLEWWPGTYELRLIGVFDRVKGYRYYTDVGAFFKKELTKNAAGRRFYAHFGGSSDIIFLLDHILRRAEWMTAKAIFAGSSAVIVKVTKGGNRSWTFVDSGYLIRRPLADIGEWVGRAKGSKEAMLSENFAIMRDYNEQDCIILYEAIERLQSQLNSHGGELRATLASSALDLFRRRFLKTRIPTDRVTNERARLAYVASRVEIYRRYCLAGEYYDFNSSFPTSMTKPQPGGVRGRQSKLPDQGLYIADLSVRVPDQYLPPLAWRPADHSRILFPTGQWRGMFDCADVELLEASGGKIDNVHDVTTFEPFSDLATYVAVLHSQKQVATGYEREVWKLLLNGLYGKFAERSDKREITIRPEKTVCTCGCTEEDPCIQQIGPDIYAVKCNKEVKHCHVPIATHVTALSRALLYRSMSTCRDLYYCDTDSIVCGRGDLLPTGPNLGELKHEYSVRDGTFLAPKLYTFAKPDGTRVVRGKGFSRLTYEGFQTLADGGEVVATRMQRIREGLNADGSITPRDNVIRKGIHLKNTKRRFLNDGSSVPWTVAELSA